MPNAKTTHEEIRKEIADKLDTLERIHKARLAVRAYNTRPAAAPADRALGVRASRRFSLLAQGDSWFDYPPGTDLIDCLHSNHGHRIVNIAVAGSTLNDEAYGPVPRELFGLPTGPKQSDDPSRIAELVYRIQQDKPEALLLSAGGNDVAGDEFFSFLNNALSGLDPVNVEVLKGVVTQTFQSAYRFIIENALEAAGHKLPIFVHGYDYPWPDGRGLIHFLGWGVGPWFDATFNQKNYPRDTQTQLQQRHDILKIFINAMNDMLKELQIQFQGQVFYVDLRNTLSRNEWANELHPTNDGFAKLAAKIDAALQAQMPQAAGAVA
jgi:lysophospholipase L1-like esterase